MTIEMAIKTPRSVVKKDGKEVPFDSTKIFSALKSARKATGEFSEEYLQSLVDSATQEIARRYQDKTPTIEDIHDVVEWALFDAGFFQTARAYIIYREQRARFRRDEKTIVDVADAINEYVDGEDWRINANANQGYSLGGLIMNTSGKVIANYWLNHVYPKDIGVAHREGDLHIHDLDMLSGYCAGWSLRTLLAEGFNGVPGKVEASSPKHMSSAIGQIVNFLGTLQNEWAGAQAFSSFDTYMAPFVRKANLSYEEVMMSGDSKGRVFTFPIPTYNITPDFPWESENADLLFAMTAKYGLPY